MLSNEFMQLSLTFEAMNDSYLWVQTQYLWFVLLKLDYFDVKLDAEYVLLS